MTHPWDESSIYAYLLIEHKNQPVMDRSIYLSTRLVLMGIQTMGYGLQSKKAFQVPKMEESSPEKKKLQGGLVGYGKNIPAFHRRAFFQVFQVKIFCEDVFCILWYLKGGM